MPAFVNDKITIFCFICHCLNSAIFRFQIYMGFTMQSFMRWINESPFENMNCKIIRPANNDGGKKLNASISMLALENKWVCELKAKRKKSFGWGLAITYISIVCNISTVQRAIDMYRPYIRGVQCINMNNDCCVCRFALCALICFCAYSYTHIHI